MRPPALTSPALALSAEAVRRLEAEVAAALDRAGLGQEAGAMFLADLAGVRIGLSASPDIAATRLRRARNRLALAASAGLNAMRPHWDGLDHGGGAPCSPRP
ncbi:hypothetical protein [Zavarzinia aquatilis]|uniref:Uncharacterized protein n=1 Tax=Zavarzinia aquatilis TaxID=2211142 RepID=A0A317EHP9_9PROT|nr:hypothetical protein [Zavarzinia aquatilis]PWR24953.1 hypothetical protein DKG74_04075 [Zavarzinia aquatilis]